MQKRSIVTVAVVFLLSAASSAQEREPSALLRDGAAHQISHFCSREGVNHFDGSWRPTATDMELLQSRLGEVSRLLRRDQSKAIERVDADRYYRQYIPFVAHGRKLVYVNAFLMITPPSSWQTRVVNICDIDGWGVVYDPATGRFSNLQVNAVLRVPPPPPKSS